MKKRQNIAGRLWKKVWKRGPTDHWPFLGYIGKDGLGKIWYNGQAIASHRAVYIATHGPIAKGQIILSCPILADCCNPEHIGLGTYKDLADRMLWSKGLRRKRPKGPRPRKLSDEQVRQIFLSTKGTNELAEHFNVSRALISRIRHRQKYIRVTRSLEHVQRDIVVEECTSVLASPQEDTGRSKDCAELDHA